MFAWTRVHGATGVHEGAGVQAPVDADRSPQTLRPGPETPANREGLTSSASLLPLQELNPNGSWP